MAENNTQNDYESDVDENASGPEEEEFSKPNPKTALQTKPQSQPQPEVQPQQQQQQQQQLQRQKQANADAEDKEKSTVPHFRTYGDMHERRYAVRESRIKDRPSGGKPAGDSALKIKIELDLEVEVDLYARVKGDVTIGLM